MKHLFLVISLFFLFTTADYTVKKVDIKCTSMLTDHLGNLYTVNHYSISKYDVNGGLLATYSNNFLGEIFYADVTDPFRILLYFREFNQIQLLDKNLAEISSAINLDGLDIQQSEIACSSNMGGFWVYDGMTTQISYINRVLESEINSIGVNSAIEVNESPNFFIEKNDFLFINFPSTGILVFDRFGSFFKIIPLTNLKSFQVINKVILFHENNALHQYNYLKLSTSSEKLPDTMGVIDARIEQNRYYIHKPNNVLIYSEAEE